MFCFGIEFNGKIVAFKKFSDHFALNAFLDPTSPGIFGEDRAKFLKELQDRVAVGHPDWQGPDQIAANVATESEVSDFDIEFNDRSDPNETEEDFTYWPIAVEKPVRPRTTRVAYRIG